MYTHTEARPQTSNRILNALTRSEFESLSPHLDPINLSSSEILYRPEQPITHVYFSSRGTVSLVSTFEDGNTVEVGMVGNEGMFGVCVFLGSVSTPLTAQVQLPEALSCECYPLVKKEFARLVGANGHAACV